MLSYLNLAKKSPNILFLSVMVILLFCDLTSLWLSNTIEVVANVFYWTTIVTTEPIQIFLMTAKPFGRAIFIKKAFRSKIISWLADSLYFFEPKSAVSTLLSIPELELLLWQILCEKFREIVFLAKQFFRFRTQRPSTHVRNRAFIKLFLKLYYLLWFASFALSTLAPMFLYCSSYCKDACRRAGSYAIPILESGSVWTKPVI